MITERKKSAMCWIVGIILIFDVSILSLIAIRHDWTGYKKLTSKDLIYDRKIGGGTIYFPPGKWEIDNPIFYKLLNQMSKCQGRHSTITNDGSITCDD